MQNNSQKYHFLLADYYLKKPIFNNGSSGQYPNLRKLTEQPFQTALTQNFIEFKNTLCNFNFIRAKLEILGIDILCLDYDLISKDVDDDIKILKEVLQLSKHILRSDQTQLAAQIKCRLNPESSSALQDIIENIDNWKDRIWIKPIKPSLKSQGGLLRTIEGFNGHISAFTVTTNGKIIVSSYCGVFSYDYGKPCHYLLKVLDFNTGISLSILTTQKERINKLVVTENNKLVLAIQELTISVWEIETGKHLTDLVGHQQKITNVALISDRIVVSSSEDTTVKLWDLYIGKAIGSFNEHLIGVKDIIVASDNLIISISHDCIHIWEIDSGKIVRSFKPSTVQERFWCGAITSDNKLVILASSSRNYYYLFCDLYSGFLQQKISSLNNSFFVHPVIVTNKGKIISKGSSYGNFSGKVEIVDLESSKTELLLDDLGGDNSIAVVDDNLLITSSARNTLKIWSISRDLSCIEIRKHKASFNGVTNILFTNDGNVISGSEKSIIVWDRLSGSYQSSFEMDLPFDKLGISSDNKLISVSGYKISIWDLASGKILASLNNPERIIHSISVTDDRIITGSGDCIDIWDLKSYNHLRSIENIISDGKYFVTTENRIIVYDLNSCIRVFDALTGNYLYEMEQPPEIEIESLWRLSTQVGNSTLIKMPQKFDLKHSRREVLSLNISADKSRLFITADNFTIFIWDISKGKFLYSGVYNIHSTTSSVPEHFDIYGLTFDNLAISRSYKMSQTEHIRISLWKNINEQVIATFSCDSKPTACCLSQDSRSFVLGDNEGNVHFLEIVIPKN